MAEQIVEGKLKHIVACCNALEREVAVCDKECAMALVSGLQSMRYAAQDCLHVLYGCDMVYKTKVDTGNLREG